MKTKGKWHAEFSECGIFEQLTHPFSHLILKVHREFFLKSYNTDSMYNLMYEDTSLGSFTMLRHWNESGNAFNKYIQEYNYDAQDPTGLPLCEHYPSSTLFGNYAFSTDLAEALSTQSNQDMYMVFTPITQPELETKGADDHRTLGSQYTFEIGETMAFDSFDASTLGITINDWDGGILDFTIINLAIHGSTTGGAGGGCDCGCCSTGSGGPGGDPGPDPYTPPTIEIPLLGTIFDALGECIYLWKVFMSHEDDEQPYIGGHSGDRHLLMDAFSEAGHAEGTTCRIHGHTIRCVVVIVGAWADEAGSWLNENGGAPQCGTGMISNGIETYHCATNNDANSLIDTVVPGNACFVNLSWHGAPGDPTHEYCPANPDGTPRGKEVINSKDEGEALRDNIRGDALVLDGGCDSANTGLTGSCSAASLSEGLGNKGTVKGANGHSGYIHIPPIGSVAWGGFDYFEGGDRTKKPHRKQKNPTKDRSKPKQRPSLIAPVVQPDILCQELS